MNNRYWHIFKSIMIVLTGLFLATSCAPTKQSAYFRINKEVDNLELPDQTYESLKDSLYIIKPGDELYITVTTSDNEPTNFSAGTQGVSTTTLGVEFISYLVDRDGFVRLPYTGKIKLSELTIDEATIIIETELSQYLYQPVASIKLVNTRITILGEVASPGVYTVNNKPINIYQAIGYAGDITIFGNRKKVLIVREENNIVTKKYIDLTNDAILGSPWYTLRPNDIVYVEPLSRRIFGMETVPWSLITSAISTTVVIMTFMITILN
jgi:polysaccharide export outer membrane protein